MIARNQEFALQLSSGESQGQDMLREDPDQL